MGLRRNAASNEQTFFFVFVRTKLKAFADRKIKHCSNDVPKVLFDTVENAVGKRENAGNQHFLFFSQCFPKPSVGWLQLELFGKELKNQYLKVPIASN